MPGGSGWGLPTAESIQQVRASAPTVRIIASGGLKDGVDVAKCVALGASMCGLAGPLLRAADQGPEAVVEKLGELTDTLRIAMFATGCATIDEMHTRPVIVSTPA